MRTLLPLLVCLLLGSVAWAQGPLPAAARKHLERGIELYAAGRYGESAAEFEAGLRVADHADLWYALGQAERRRGDCDAALRAYRRFLSTRPPQDEAQRAEANIKRCEEDLAAQRSETPPEPDPAPRGSAQPPATLTRPADTAAAPGSDWAALQIIGAGVAVTGAAVVGAGVFFAVRAQSDWDALNAAAARHEVWSSDLQRRYDSADASDDRATLLFVAGGAAAAVGGILFFLGTRGRDGRKTARPAVIDLLGSARPTGAWERGVRGGRVGAAWVF
jgi:tetratricopeptide (TPR) repeat protein